MNERIQVLPFPKVHPVWEHDWSVYPDIIRVPMSDGRVLNYYRVIEQSAPIMGKWLDDFEKTYHIEPQAKEQRKTRIERRKGHELSGD